MVVMLAKTGVTKAGYLLKRQSPAPKSNRWESYFIVLNDHCISYCNERSSFERAEGTLVLTSGTRVYSEPSAVVRIETGSEVMILKGKDEAEMKDWQKAIHSNVGRLAELARGQFRVKAKGKDKSYFLMLHRECITCHPSFSDSAKILKIYQLNELSSFDVKGDSIELKSGAKGDETMTITAKNDIEHQHWCYALDIATSRLRKAKKTIIPPPTLPVHSGSLLCLDRDSMKWKKKYVVLTEDSIFMHRHRRVGFDTPQKFDLTPNSMIFSTTLKEHSFELVLFSDSIHLQANSDAERGEWIFILQKLIPSSDYDKSDMLQVASLEKPVRTLEIEFHSESQPGILMERRGNWAIAALVSESLSRTVCQGSVLSKIEDESILLSGFESVVSKLGYWQAPLRLTFQLSPQKMGWLTLFVKEKDRPWFNIIGSRRKTCNEANWEKVYATLSSGVLTLFAVKRDGKSKKKEISLHGSAVGLFHNVIDGSKHCFRVLDGIDEPIMLQADSHDSMIDWAASVAQSISMENGGGLLLDTEKRALAKEGFWLKGNEFATKPESSASVLQGLNDESQSSIVFTKTIKDLSFEPEPIGDTYLEPITEKFPSNINPTHVADTARLDPIAEKDPQNLNATHVTDVTCHEPIVKKTPSDPDTTYVTDANTTFNSLDPADLSQSMEAFASNFFVTKPLQMRQKIPIQALRTDASEPWMAIDRVSTSSSASEIFDKVSDFDERSHHIDSEEFSKLFQFTKEAKGNH